SAGTSQRDTRVGREGQPIDVIPADPHFRAVPLYIQSQRLIGTPPAWKNFAADAIRLSDKARHLLQPIPFLFPFSLMVPLVPHFYGCQHPHNVLFVDFQRSSVSMMGSTVQKGCVAQILAAKEKPGALRSPQGLTSAVRHQIGSPLKMYLRIKVFSSRIDEYGNPMTLANATDRLESKFPGVVSFIGQNVDHSRAWINGSLQLTQISHGDHSDPSHSDPVVIYISRP